MEKEPSIFEELLPRNWSFRERLFLGGMTTLLLTVLSLDYLLNHEDRKPSYGVPSPRTHSQGAPRHAPQSLEESLDEPREEPSQAEQQIERSQGSSKEGEQQSYEPQFRNERDHVAYRPVVREAIDRCFSDYHFGKHETTLKREIERLVLSMLIQESRVSHYNDDGTVVRSNKGAMGVGQHMEINIRDLRNRGYKFTWSAVRHNPELNAQATVATVRERFRDFNIRPQGDHFKESDRAKVGASYNAGLTRVTDACDRSGNSVDFERYLHPHYVGGASRETLPYTRGLVALMTMYDPARVTDMGIVVTNFGPYTDPLHHTSGYRYGITFLPAEAGVKGDPIYAPYAGRVVFAGKNSDVHGYGNYVKIGLDGGSRDRESKPLKRGVYVCLLDLDNVQVRRGDKIKAGQKIGTMGNSSIGCVATRLMITFEGENYGHTKGGGEFFRYIDPGYFYAGPSRLETIAGDLPPEQVQVQSGVLGMLGVSQLLHRSTTPREAWLSGQERIVQECKAVGDYGTAIHVYQKMLPVVGEPSDIERKISQLQRGLHASG